MTVESVRTTVRQTLQSPARSNAAGSLLIQASQRLGRFLVIMIAAAVLLPVPFAAAAIALALTDLVRGSLIAFDIVAVRRLAAGDPTTSVLGSNLGAKILVGLIGVGIGVAAGAAIADSGTAGLVGVAGVGMLAGSLATSFLVPHQAVLGLARISVRVAIANAAGAVVALLLLWTFPTALSLVAGLTVTDVLMFVVLVGGRWCAPDWPAARALVNDTRQLLIMQLAHMGQFRVGAIVLAAYGSAVAVAEYTVASRLAEGLVIVAGAVTASSLPLMGAAHAQDIQADVSRLFARSYRTSILLVGPLIAGLVVTTPWWIALVPRYPDAGYAMAVVGLGVMVFFASSQTTALLNATSHDGAASRAAVSGLTVSVLVSLPLAQFGAVGVAWARLAGESVRLMAEVLSTRHLRIAQWIFVRPWLETVPLLGGIGLALEYRWQAPWIWIAAILVAATSAVLLYSIGSAAQSGAGPIQRTPPKPTPNSRRSSD